MSGNVKTKSHDFTDWAHSFGRWGTVVCLLYMIAIPIIVCTVYDCWPEMSALGKAAMGILPVFVPVGLSEALSYTPILGSSCYLTFITGNIMNMKLPCAINAQKVTGSGQNTPKGDAIAIVAVATVSIITIVVIALGAIFLVPLQPLLQKPVIQTATSYIIPALMGSLFFGMMGKGEGEKVVDKKLLSVIVPLILCSIGVITGILTTSTQGFGILLMMPVTIICARILWKKGIIKVVSTVKPAATQEAKVEVKK